MLYYPNLHFDFLDFDYLDFDFDFLNLDEFMSDTAAESSKDVAVSSEDLLNSNAPEPSAASLNEAIIQTGGSIRLNQESVGLLSDDLPDAESQSKETQNDFVAELDSIINRTREETKQESSYSLFADCPKCGKSVLKGMTCPECGTQVL